MFLVTPCNHTVCFCFTRKNFRIKLPSILLEEHYDGAGDWDCLQPPMCNNWLRFLIRNDFLIDRFHWQRNYDNNFGVPRKIITCRVFFSWCIGWFIVQIQSWIESNDSGWSVGLWSWWFGWCIFVTDIEGNWYINGRSEILAIQLEKGKRRNG